MFLYSTYSMKLAAISMAAVTICGSKLIKDWQVHNLLVNVAKAWFKRRILHAPNQILILVDSN